MNGSRAEKMNARFAKRADLLPWAWGLVALTVAGCGVEARSESQLPAGAEPIVAVPTDRLALVERVDLEAEWAARLEAEQARADQEGIQEATAPHRSPILAATDQGERQVRTVEAEPTLLPVPDAPRSEAEPVGTWLPAGLEFVAIAEREVSTEEDQAGDVFYAELVDDVLADDGLVLLPRGARLVGRVVESRASEDAQVAPSLTLAIESLLGPWGERPMHGSVLQADIEVDERDSGRRSAAKVLGGAAAGALLGRILGDDGGDAAKGGVVGAAAGAAVALGTRGGHARLPEGGQLVIRLEDAVLVSD